MSKLYLCAFILFGFTSCAQVSQSFKQSHFFAQPTSYGRELRDINGEPVARKQDTLYFIYLQTAKQADINITSVQYNGKLFHAAVYPVNGETVRVGVAESGEEVLISNKQGYSLVRIELTADPDRKLQSSVPKNNLQINGRLNAKPFRLVLKKKTMLAAEIRG